MPVAEEEFDPTRILVVEDEGAMLRTHGRVLEAHGFLPILMADPSEALVEAKERTPAVVVVDLVMPGMSGLELVTRLRTHYGRSCPPVLLVSANLTQLSPMEQILFDHLFPKPYSVNAFIGVVRSMVRAHVARRASPNPSRQQSAGARREDDGR